MSIGPSFLTVSLSRRTLQPGERPGLLTPRSNGRACKKSRLARLISWYLSTLPETLARQTPGSLNPALNGRASVRIRRGQSLRAMADVALEQRVAQRLSLSLSLSHGLTTWIGHQPSFFLDLSFQMYTSLGRVLEGVERNGRM